MNVLSRCVLSVFFSCHQAAFAAWPAAVILTLVAAATAESQVYQPWQNQRYRLPAGGYRPPNVNQPLVGRFAGEGVNDPSHISHRDFRNPSLELLKELGEMPVAGMPEPYQIFPRVAGEFEPQQAIVVSLSDLMPQHYNVLKQIIAKTSLKANLLILVNDRRQLKDGLEIAESAAVDLSHVSFLELPLDTIWLRDFGPHFMETATGALATDFLYDGTRPKDDQLPLTWSNRSRDTHRKISWTLQGGNLLTNGRGLAIASTRVFEDNMIRFPQPTPGMNEEYERRKIVVEGFKKDCNLDRIVFLHPLKPEATRHVDMFATFLAPDHALIAEVDRRVDSYNANIMDQNAAIMKSLTVDGKPMRVDRIMLPPRQDKYWSPYTNIIQCNQLILMPVYDSDPPDLVAKAVETYRRLKPDASVETINLTSMQKLEGALHCMSINIPSFAKLPKSIISLAQARSALQLPPSKFPTDSEIAFLPPRKDLRVNVRQRVNESDLAEFGTPKARPDEREPKAQQPVAPGSSPDTGRARPTPNGNASKSTPNSNPSQLEAALTYRRTFQAAQGTYSVDAIAIGVTPEKIYLMKVADRSTIAVNRIQLSEEDRGWIDQNAEKIRANGRLVQAFFSRNPIQ